MYNMEMEHFKFYIQKEYIKVHGKTVNFKEMDKLFIKMEHDIKVASVKEKKMEMVNYSFQMEQYMKALFVKT